MFRIYWLGTLVLLGTLAAGCERRQSLEQTKKATGGSDSTFTAADERSGYPTKEWMLEYLDGKSLTFPDSTAQEEAATLLIQKEGIEALQFADTASSVNGGPWSTELTFLYNTGEKRYAVVGSIEYREVEGQFAFFGFDVTTIAEQ